jgi:hypothetical protein
MYFCSLFYDSFSVSTHIAKLGFDVNSLRVKMNLQILQQEIFWSAKLSWTYQENDLVSKRNKTTAFLSRVAVYCNGVHIFCKYV